MGGTALFLVIFTALIFLYQRRFEIQTAAFVGIAGFLGSLVYLAVFGYDNIFLQALVNALMSVLFFRVMMSSFHRV